VRKPHLDFLALTSRLLEALGTNERPGNVAGHRSPLIVGRINFALEYSYGASSRCRQAMSQQGCRGADERAIASGATIEFQINISTFRSPSREIRYEPVMKMRLLA
jgi:hypothetical protein